MLAFCQNNIGSAIPPKERYLGEVDETNYSPLSVGESYAVHALLFMFDRVDFLVRAPEQPPFWVPSSLFRLVDARVPACWEFCITQTRPDYKSLFDAFKISYVMGYPLLVNEYKHYVGIVERDPEEVLRFTINESINQQQELKEKGTDLFSPMKELQGIEIQLNESPDKQTKGVGVNKF